MTDAFPVATLPYGSVSRGPGAPPRLCVALGDHAIELAAIADRLPDVPRELIDAPNLDRLLRAGPAEWAGLRDALPDAVSGGDLPAAASMPLADVSCRLPFAVGDYVDFYSSLEHATNLGRMFRPGSEPLLPNWRHLPVGYHGRAGTVVVSGTPVRRPVGQRPAPDGPVYGPSRRLDIELELGFVTGGEANRAGEPLAIDDVHERIFGFVLVNDWSARDIQAWEYQPLGPFLGKSFATSISAWVVPLAALESARVDGPPQDPEPFPYLRTDAPWGFDVSLEVALRPAGGAEQTISRTNARELYWTVAQQLAHASSNGAVVRPGDLFASGTISGAARGSQGSLIELTCNGSEPLELGGETRTFLEDGDEVVLRGRTPDAVLGEVRGTILPAPG